MLSSLFKKVFDGIVIVFLAMDSMVDGFPYFCPSASDVYVVIVVDLG